MTLEKVFLAAMMVTSLVYGDHGDYTEYKGSCPGPTLWVAVGRKFCPDQSNYVRYHCLAIAEQDNFTHICLEYRHISKGVYPVVDSINRFNMDARDCPPDRYQPSPRFSHETNTCLNQKSRCNEEGQVIFSNGSTTTDRSCRCDYSQGYTFVTPPRNGCSCVPSEEDCSCYLMNCGENHVLNQDYKCSHVDDTSSGIITYQCPVLRRQTQRVMNEESDKSSVGPPGEGKSSSVSTKEFRNIPLGIICITVTVIAVTFAVVLEKVSKCIFKKFYREDNEGISVHGNRTSQPDHQPDVTEVLVEKSTDEPFDVILMYMDIDCGKAQEFRRRLKGIAPDIKVAFMDELNTPPSITALAVTNYLLSQGRYIFVLITEGFKLNKLQRHQAENVILKLLVDPEKLFRVVPVTMAGPQHIPEELVTLADIKYYHYLEAESKGKEDLIFICTIKKIVDYGRKTYLLDTD